MPVGMSPVPPLLMSPYGLLLKAYWLSSLSWLQLQL